MTREERELRSQIAQLKNEARTLVSDDKMPEAQAKAAEAQNLADKADLLAKLEDVNDPKATPIGTGEAKDAKELSDLYNSAFFNSFRNKKLNDSERNAVKLYNALSESSDAAGGLLVPQDVQTTINRYMRTLPELQQLINVIPVSTNGGTRVYETLATMTALANITDDTADIPEEAGPAFEKVTYAIKKYAGWLPVPNDLLNDSDQNIQAYLTEWIGRKSVVTRNSLILAILNAITPTTFADYKAIKKALNITLDPMLAAGAQIVTNQDGYQYLDTLVDGQSRPMLQPDITQPGRYLFAGKPVKVIPNTTLVTTGTTTKLAPMFVGNLGEAITMFERQGYQIASTNVGGTAFRKDRTELRVIEREDVKKIDASAVIFGKIDVTSILA